MINQIKAALQDLANPKKAEILMRFFKTGKGEYGEGDSFLGIVVPQQRIVAKTFYTSVTLEEIKELLRSNIHEYRLTALLMLVLQFEKLNDHTAKKKIVDFYLTQTDRINNWDLVDTSCYKILGRFCFENAQEEILFKLAESEVLWEKRMAVVATLYFIKNNSLEIVPEIILINLQHPHDLMHKANGWMLREMGKINDEKLLHFLDEYAPKMPRTTLRYAIEKLDPSLKAFYMQLKKA